jgi:hypothetical protein
MRPAMHKSMVKAGWFAGVYLAIFLVRMVYAQDAQPAGQTYIYNYKHGGTALSYQIEAEADYVIAQGDFQKSVAIARKINAEAVAQEIKNSVDYVDAYFKRQELNKEWRHKLNPSDYETYLEFEKHRQEVMKQKIEIYFHDTLNGDVTSELNHLLQELYVVQYMSPGDLNPLDSPLAKEDLEQIYLTDGGHGDSKLVFAISTGEMLKTPWPYALRRSEFDAQRKEFEVSRDELIKEIQEKGQASEENGERLFKAVNQLLVTLDSVYTKEDLMDSRLFLHQYSPAKNFLNSLIVQVTRAQTTNDRSVFNGSLNFKGETLIALIQHMSKMGLTFDRPQKGGERVYAGLFMKMRSLYLTLVTEKSNSGKLPAKN